MPSEKKSDKTPFREPGQSRFYGRRQTRPPKGERKEALDRLLPALQIPSPPVFPVFGNNNETWFEIGFGDGEHLAALMQRHPEINFIGAEPFINGMSSFLKRIETLPHDNIRVFSDDAIVLVDAMPDACLSRLYVLNPDPWPKKRHHKRRIISQENLTRFARVLKPGAILIMTTDVDDLAEWMVTQASMHPAFEWTAESAADWQTMPSDWVRTRYERKGAAKGRRQSYLIFRKKLAA